MNGRSSFQLGGDIGPTVYRAPTIQHGTVKRSKFKEEGHVKLRQAFGKKGRMNIDTL